jgi:ketosteroid isomerase-like protein
MTAVVSIGTLILPSYPDAFQTEMRDVCLTVSDDVTLAHRRWRFTGLEQDHPAMQPWLRSTASDRRIRGRWQIMHEHPTVPGNPEPSHTAFTQDR